MSQGPIVRSGDRKEEWDKMFGMTSNIRSQYILDKFLKKESKGYRSAADRKADLEDFKEILTIGWFCKGDLAKYYTLKSDKIPPPLVKKYEDLVLDTVTPSKKLESKPQKKSIKKPSGASHKKSKISPPDLEDKKDIFRYLKEVEESEKTSKELHPELVKRGFLQSKVTKDTGRALDNIRKQLTKEKERVSKDIEMVEFSSKSKDSTKPSWLVKKDADNYNNMGYLNKKKKEQETYLLNKDLNSKNREGKASVESIQKSMESMRLQDKQRRDSLPVGIRLKELGKYLKELSLEDKNRRPAIIKIDDITKKRRRSGSSSSSRSSISTNAPVSASTNSNRSYSGASSRRSSIGE